MTRSCFDFTSREFKSDPSPTLIRLRKFGPLVRTWIERTGEVWLTTNYETTAVVLRSRDMFVTDPADIERGIEWMERIGDRSIKELPLLVSTTVSSNNKEKSYVA